MPDPARKEENRLKSEEDKIKTRKDKYHAQQDAFQARALAENMVRPPIHYTYIIYNYIDSLVGSGGGLIDVDHAFAKADVPALGRGGDDDAQSAGSARGKRGDCAGKRVGRVRVGCALQEHAAVGRRRDMSWLYFGHSLESGGASRPSHPALALAHSSGHSRGPPSHRWPVTAGSNSRQSAPCVRAHPALQYNPYTIL